MPRERILLTGGSGLLGRTLTPMLAESYQVVHFDLIDPGDGHPFVQGDLRDAGAVAKACANMDAIIHAAALHGKAWAQAGDQVGFDINVIGTKNILEGAAKAGPRRVVFTSSIWATGHPPPPAPYLPIDEDLPRQPIELYGLTKLLGEQMCGYTSANHGLSTICLRPGGIQPAAGYRPGQVHLLDGTVDVRDVAQAHLLGLEAPENLRHEIFVITAASPLCQVDPQAFQADPAGTLEQVLPGAAAFLAEHQLEVPPDLEWFSIEKARRGLGYEPEYNFKISD